MAEMECIPAGDAGQTKACSQCGIAKRREDFHTRRASSDGLLSYCKACRRRLYATPEKKAEARRKDGLVTSPYVPQAERLEIARRDREARAAMRVAAATARASARAKAKLTPGSKAWYASASPEQIEEYRRAARERYRKRYAAQAPAERARTRRYKLANPRVGSKRWFEAASLAEIDASGLKPPEPRKPSRKKVGHRARREKLVSARRDGTLTPKVVRAMMSAAHKCPYCRKAMGAADKSLDHIVPLSRGGLHSKTNALICCKACNSTKRDLLPEEWVATLADVAQAHAERRIRRASGAPITQAALPLTVAAGPHPTRSGPIDGGPAPRGLATPTVL